MTAFYHPLAPRTSLLVRIWRFRELLRGLVIRNLKVRYQRSALGFFWTVINPLLTVVILLAVFTYVVPIGVRHYWAFLLSGYFVWNFLVNTLNTSAFTIPDHADMVRSMVFPTETLVLGAIIARLIEYLMTLVLLALMIALFHHRAIPSSFALLPLLTALQFLLAVGLALPIAALSVFFHDVQHALPVALTLLMYISPVFYPPHYVPAAVRSIYLLNPIAGVLALYQTVLYEGRLPSLPLLAEVTVMSILVCLVGHGVFRHYQAVFAERV